MSTLPNSFTNVTAATGAQLDQNFAALGALTPIPCTLAGTSSLTLTPNTNTPAVTSYANYMPFTAVAAGPNAGAVSLRIGALPLLPVYRDSSAGPVALTGYEIQAGNLLYFTYDSALNSGAGGFHVVITFTNAIVGTERGLTGSAPGGTKNATWTVKEVIAEVAIGGAAVKGSSLSLFFYGATVGAGGMDAGTIPVSGSLAVYAIYSPALNSWSTLGYASGAAAPAPVYPGSNAPAGYAFSVLLWTGLTDSSGNIIHFQQFDRSVFSGPTSVVSATAATANTYATASVSAAVPYGALTAWGTAGSTSTAAAAQVAVASDTSGSFVQQVVAGFSAVALDGYGTAGSFGPIPLTTPQQIAWKAGTNTVNTTIKLVGYTF